MKVSQIHDLVNTAISETSGKLPLLKEDLSNVVDVGTEIFNGDNVDNYVHKLVDRIGYTTFNNRIYQGSAPSILMNSWEYGSVMQKVDTELPTAEENDSWNLQDKTDYSPNIFYQPKVTAKFFNSKVTFDIPLSFTAMQVKESFNNANELNGFISMLQNSVVNAMTLNLDNLIMRTLNNMTANVINANQPNTSVNLLTLYNNAKGTSLKAKDALSDKEFIRFANYTINTFKDRISKFSTLFNVGGKQRFTPSTSQHLILLSDFENSSKVYLESDTQHQDLVTVNGFESVPYWQGSGQNYNFEDISKIDVQIKDGDTSKEIVQTGIIGLLFDTNATGVNCSNQRVTTNFNPKAEFYTNFTKYDASYYNDLNENYVVFYIADSATSNK
ncbi:MAG: hypothetical protein [Caudoviricetes sp.]|nr:MAG: hypothetical protein [Caudoviricetes sp.]